MITPDLSERFGSGLAGSAYNQREVASPELTTRTPLAAVLAAQEMVAPERALAAGVLRQAAVDLRRFRNAKDAAGREMYADAYSWFFANDADWPYSFSNVCEVLGLSSEAVVDEIFADADSTWYAHSGHVVRGLARSMKASLSTLFAGRRSASFAAAHP